MALSNSFKEIVESASRDDSEAKTKIDRDLKLNLAMFGPNTLCRCFPNWGR